MSQTSPLRVALIGCGNIGAAGHAPAYARIPGAGLSIVCDSQRERAELLAKQSGAEPCFDYREALERPDIDMVDLCLPTKLHSAAAVEALEAGKHVLCEKPMAHSLEAADAMIAAAERTGLRLMIAHVRRFDHRYTQIKDEIDTGKIGNPVFIHRAERQHLPFPSEAWQWHIDQGGDVMLDIGVHVTDLFQWFFGEQASEVYAVGRSIREQAREADSYDYALMICKFRGNKTGLAELSWAHPPGFGGSLYSELDVVGTKGKIRYSDKDTNPMLAYSEDGGHALPRFFRFMSTTEYAFEEEIRHFVGCILGNHKPIISLAEARSALEVALAAHYSSQSGLPVRIPLEIDVE